jgi:GTP-binding protein
MAPWDDVTPAEAAVVAVNELKKFSQTLSEQPRWLVLNKMDMVPEEEREERIQSVVDALDWQGTVYPISALGQQGTDDMMRDIQAFLDQRLEAIEEDPSILEEEQRIRDLVDFEARQRVEELRQAARARRAGDDDLDDDFDDDDYDVEVEWVRE